MSIPHPRIYLSRTSLEWDLIERRVKELGAKNINSYIRSKIKELSEEAEACPHKIECLSGISIQKTQYLRIDQFEIISTIANKAGVSGGTIVNRLIIEPLLIK